MSPYGKWIHILNGFTSSFEKQFHPKEKKKE